MKLSEKFDASWHPILNVLYQEPLTTLNQEILPVSSFQPSKDNIFNVFSMPVEDTKVVVLGQDPYPRPGDALGYSFAVNPERKIPTSLRIISQEINQEMGYGKERTSLPEWKSLGHWREQGVFLLNTALTVETGKAGSHLKYWAEFTKRVISHISLNKPCVWLLWGKKAQAYIPYIKHNPFIVKGYNLQTIQEIPANPDWNYVLTAPHPAAEAYSGGKAGFYGCNHFTFANTILNRRKEEAINW